MPHVTYRLSSVTFDMTPVTCHMSPATCHLSPVGPGLAFCFKPGRARKEDPVAVVLFRTVMYVEYMPTFIGV